MCDKNGVITERFKDYVNQYTREEIAAAIGCDTSLVTKHYNGDRTITLDYAIKYAHFFGITVDYLVGLSDVPTPKADIRAICDYTGLNEDSIFTLNNIKHMADEEQESLPIRERDDLFAFDELARRTLDLINAFLSDEYTLVELVETLITNVITNSTFINVLSEVFILKLDNAQSCNISAFRSEIDNDYLELQKAYKNLKYAKYDIQEIFLKIIKDFYSKYEGSAKQSFDKATECREKFLKNLFKKDGEPNGDD